MSSNEFKPTQFLSVFLLLAIGSPMLFAYFCLPYSEVKSAQLETTEAFNKMHEKLTELTSKVDKIQGDYSYKYAQTKTLRHLIDMKTLSGDQCVQVADVIRRKSVEIGISEDAVVAMIMTESDGNPKSTIFHTIDGKVLEGLCGVRGIAVREAIGKAKYKGDNPAQNVLAWFSYMEYIKSLPKFEKCTDELLLLKAWNRGPFHTDYNDAQAQKYARKIKYYKEQLR